MVSARFRNRYVAWRRKISSTDASFSYLVDLSHLFTRSTAIVKFRYHSIRDDILRARRILKGTRLSIHEDLTAVNVQTLNRIRNNPRVSTTWSWNGRLFALLKSSRVPIVVKPYETLDQCILNQASDD